MCITSDEAKLRSTLIGVWDLDHPDHGYRHVLAYQNAPENLVEGPNSMILAIPTHQELKQEHILNTERDMDFLKKMADLVAPERFTRSEPPRNMVFEMGIYHIAILNDPNEHTLDTCLAAIPEEKRPSIGLDLLAFYQDTYRGFPLLICCFSSKDVKDSSPILVHFDPAYPDTFMFNTVDAHGEVPKLGEPVIFHQRIIIGSHKIKEAYGDFQAFDHSGLSPHLIPYLAKFGQGTHIKDYIPNYDILVDNRELAHSDNINIGLGILGKA